MRALLVGKKLCDFITPRSISVLVSLSATNNMKCITMCYIKSTCNFKLLYYQSSDTQCTQHKPVVQALARAVLPLAVVECVWIYSEYSSPTLFCRGVPDRHHLLRELRLNTALAVDVDRSLIMWASSRMTRNQDTMCSML
jgi:hypothetical protein